MIRPEAFSIVGRAGGADSPTLRGRVVLRSFLGSMARYWIETPQGEMIVDDTAFESHPLGDEVTLAMSPERLHLLPAAS
jgi:hypothetical protein